MSKTIADYTAAISIDPANDFLLIEPSGNTVYKKISRNVFLGLSSAPIGTTDSQSPTNKTFDNTNIFTIRDDRLTLQDDSDTTKQAKFQLSGITTGTTRTYTLPNATDTLAGISATQTFTNKTLTSPIITGGTIDNSTITVDSIAGHSTSTIVTVANLQISNGVLNSANAVTATSIAAGAVQPQALVTGTGSGWAYQNYIPALTNVTVGNGALSTSYIQIGKTVQYKGIFSLGTTSSVTGSIIIPLPVTARNDSFAGSTVSPIGITTMFDSGTAQYPGAVYLGSTTALTLQPYNVAGTYATTTQIANATVPFTFGTGDGFIWNVTYEAA